MKISVLGAGGWGLALALSAFRNGHEVAVWSPFEKEVSELLEKHESVKLLAGVQIPQEITISTNLAVADYCDAVIMAVPSFAVAETAKRLNQVKELKMVINVAKGFDPATGKRLSQIISEQVSAPVIILSGPSHAEEVARMVPTSIVATAERLDNAETVMDIFSSKNLRIYSNNDIVGVELGGALKNVIAVAAGFCDGMQLGDNTKAALITRGLSEMARLGVKMGAKEQTFTGLTGLGDLIVTCTSVHSRNHRFGEMVGRGISVEKALEEVGTVEGYYACKIAHSYAEKLGVEMPILNQCYQVLYHNASAKQALEHLMLRPNRPENETLWLND